MGIPCNSTEERDKKLLAVGCCLAGCVGLVSVFKGCVFTTDGIVCVGSIAASLSIGMGSGCLVWLVCLGVVVDGCSHCCLDWCVGLDVVVVNCRVSVAWFAFITDQIPFT